MIIKILWIASEGKKKQKLWLYFVFKRSVSPQLHFTSFLKHKMVEVSFMNTDYSNVYCNRTGKKLYTLYSYFVL